MSKKTKRPKVKNMLTVSEAAEMAGLGTPQILYRIKTEKIKAQKLGWFWVIPRSEVEKLLEEEDE